MSNMRDAWYAAGSYPKREWSWEDDGALVATDRDLGLAMSIGVPPHDLATAAKKLQHSMTCLRAARAGFLATPDSANRQQQGK